MKKIHDGKLYVQYKDLVLINEYNKVTHIKIKKFLDEYICDDNLFVLIDDLDLITFLDIIDFILTYPENSTDIEEYLFEEYENFLMLTSESFSGKSPIQIINSVPFERFLNNFLDDMATIEEYHSDRTNFNR